MNQIIVNAAPWCIATVVTEKAIEGLLESGSGGVYKDSHPWLVAQDLFRSMAAQNQALPILLASGQPLAFSRWSVIEEINVVELHLGQWETACRFEAPKPMHPIFLELGSVFLKPASEQLERERREGLRQHRTALDEMHVHPYAICETPAFILVPPADGDA